VKNDLILRVAAKLLMPFMLLFAVYVQFHGDFGPGGGFQAGVIGAAAVVFYAWQDNTGEETLGAWLARHVAAWTPDAAAGAPAAADRLARAYGNPRLTIADYGYLLDLHPLEIWCAGELIQTPGLSFEDLTARADGTVAGLVVLAAMTAVILLTLIALLMAGPLMKLIGAKLEAMITRILGVILAALAAQFVLDGLERSLPGLAG